MTNKTAFAASLAVFALAACNSPDIATVSSLHDDIATRVGSTPDWSLPFDQMSSAWDGTSDLGALTAVQCALANNRPLRRAIEEVHIAQSELTQSSLAPNPMIEMATGFPLGMGVAPLVAMISQNLAFIAQREDAMGAASQRLRSALLELGSLAVDTAAAARSLQMRVVMAQHLVTLSIADELIASQLVAVAQVAVDAGEAPRAELETMRLQIAEAMMRRADAQERLRSDQADLMALLGRSGQSHNWRAVESDWDTSLWRDAEDLAWTTAMDGDEDLVHAVSEWRLDVQAAQAMAASAQSQLASARGSRISRFDLSSGYEQDMEGDDAISVGLIAEVPIFDDGSARIAAAAARFQAARIDADQILQLAVAAAHKAHSQLRAAQLRLHALQTLALGAAESTALIALRSAEAGETPRSHYLSAEHAANDARMDGTNARLQVALAQIELSRVIGNPQGTP
ncbi:MAG: TolC family protein [Phycisphaerales bacterium]|nr:TolC family protein [Phycisphaerales bacterium]